MGQQAKPDAKTRPLTWNLLAEERIREAQEAGEFENLPGFGRPILGIDEPHDELWWVKEKLKREQLVNLPPALALRLDVEQTLAKVPSLKSEAEVQTELLALNDRIRKTSFAVTWGPAVDVQPVDVEEAIVRWKSTHDDSSASTPTNQPRR